MKLIFITGHRKSGTTLLGNLFDGHMDCCVYPTDFSLMYAYFPYFNNKSYSIEKKKRRIGRILHKSITDKLKDQKINLKFFNTKKFIEFFLKKLNNKNINNIKYIINLTKNLFAMINNEQKKKFFVLKETSSEIFYSTIFNKKDQLRVIHIIRDPRDNYASLKSGSKKYYNSIGEDQLTLLYSMINRAKLDFKFIELNKKIFGDNNYICIKYEDLITNPNATMKYICNKIGIKFTNELTKPSVLGHLATSNTFNKLKSKSINIESKNRWKSDLNEFEKQIINFYFHDVLTKYYKESKKNLNYNSKNLAKFYTKVNYKFFFNDSYSE